MSFDNFDATENLAEGIEDLETFDVSLKLRLVPEALSLRQRDRFQILLSC